MLKYLINLRLLYLSYETKLPVEIERLTSLQTLWYFAVGEEKGYQIEELGSLNYLKGGLEIGNVERVRDKEESMKANTLAKSNLSELALSWDAEDSVGERNDESILEGLQPHVNLKVLKIRFPTWMGKMAVWDARQGSWVPLDNLIELTLGNCSECEEIPTLEHLPNLKLLYLFRLKKARFLNSSFKNLRTLVISRLEMKCLPKQLFYNNQNISTFWIHMYLGLRENYQMAYTPSILWRS